MPGARRTRSLVCAWGSKYAHEYSQRVRRDHPASPRNGLRLMPSSPWRSGFLVTIIREVAFANLTPASRRQDHTSSPSASMPFVIGTSCVHRIPPRVRDDREPPLKWDETAGNKPMIWVGWEEEIFLQTGLDGQAKSLVCLPDVVHRCGGRHAPRKQGIQYAAAYRFNR
jgi:hypothetical protein